MNKWHWLLIVYSLQPLLMDLYDIHFLTKCVRYSLFIKIGGNPGSAFGPLLAALIVIQYGQSYRSWFYLIAMIGIFVLCRMAIWYSNHLVLKQQNKAGSKEVSRHQLSKKMVISSLVILLILIFSKCLYRQCYQLLHFFFS